MSSHTEHPSGTLIVITEVRLFREAIARVIAERAPGIVVHTATPGDALPAALASIAPDVVLIDVAAIARHQAAQEVRAAAPAARIVAFAVAENEEEVVSCAKAGAVGFVSRDAPPEDLVTAVSSALRGKLWCSADLTAVMCARLAGDQYRQPSESWLTGREREVLMLVDEGLSNKQIARRLSIEISTVKNHVHSILEKLRVKHRWQAAAAARRPGVLPVGVLDPGSRSQPAPSRPAA